MAGVFCRNVRFCRQIYVVPATLIKNSINVFQSNLFEPNLYFTDELPISSCSRCQDNQHRLTLTMKPDEEFEMKRRKLEEKKLADVLASLSDDERSSIYEKGRHDYSDCRYRLSIIIIKPVDLFS